MKKLKGFTLVELIVAMLISGIVISICYEEFFYVQSEYDYLRTGASKSIANAKLNTMLSNDFSLATIINYNNKNLELIAPIKRIKYTIQNDLIIRRSLTNIDSFKVNVVRETAKFNSVELPENAVSKIDDLQLMINIAGTDVPIHLTKQYDANSLMILPVDTIKKSNMAGIDLNKFNKPTTIKAAERGNAVSILTKLLTTEISFSGNRLSDVKKERFYSELFILFSSGIDIKTTLEIIIEQQLKAADQQLFTNIKNDIINGKSFSDALNKSNKFSVYEYYSLKIGEESGNIDKAVKDLSVFFSKKVKLNRQIVKSLSYPIIVLCTSFIAVFFMLHFVVPMFASVFKRFNSNLPPLTKFILQASDAFKTYALPVLLLIIGGIFLLSLQRKKIWFRKSSSVILLRLPIVKELVSKIYLARFCQSMYLLLSSKIPLVEAIDLVKKMIEFYPLEHSLEEIQQKVLRGTSLHESMAAYKIYPKRMLSLIKVGEEVNQLDVIFSKMANQLDEEIEYKSSIIGSLIEPVMIIFLGIFVALILIAMYLPIFQLGSSIH